ncbi:MAG: response regulator transcription factor [Chloroflexi bacterium]|nr:response regulator transcription factor [Chloroflexota bacterium]
MPWLYEHREQLDEELAYFVEIAHHFTGKVPPHDRDDVEQEIVITLKRVTQRRGDMGHDYLWAVARKVVTRYWHNTYRRARRYLCLQEGARGEIVARMWKVLSDGDRDEEWTLVADDGDKDARLDAIATLATLPQRLKEIGYKRLNGEKLSEADRFYWMRQKTKLGVPKRGDQLTDWEKRRVLKLYQEGLLVFQIARTLGRSETPIYLCLAQAGLKEAPAHMFKREHGHRYNLPASHQPAPSGNHRKGRRRIDVSLTECRDFAEVGAAPAGKGGKDDF